MKFTLFTLIATMCLLGTTSANIFKDIKHDMHHEEDKIKHKEKDIDSPVKNWIKKIFGETHGQHKDVLAGVKCLVDETLVIKKAAVRLAPQLASCGLPIPENLSPIITEAKEVSNIVEEIEDLTTNFCIGDIGETPISCIHNLLSTVFKLDSQTKTVIESIKNARSSGPCFAKALKNLQHEVTAFPAEIKVCAKSF